MFGHEDLPLFSGTPVEVKVEPFNPQAKKEPEAPTSPLSFIVYTIGYTGRDPDDLVRTVKYMGAVLVDVRYSPNSRVPCWRRRWLQDHLGESYLWVGEFGNKNYRGGPIELVEPAKGLERVRPLMERGPIILLCACTHWYECHREKVADYLAEHTGCEVNHMERTR